MNSLFDISASEQNSSYWNSFGIAELENTLYLSEINNLNWHFYSTAYDIFSLSLIKLNALWRLTLYLIRELLLYRVKIYELVIIIPC